MSVWQTNNFDASLGSLNSFFFKNIDVGMRKEHIADVRGFNRIKTGALCQEDEMLSSIMSYVSRQMCPSHVA